MTRWIFFDAAGTLFGVRGSLGKIYGETAARHGCVVPPQAIEERFRLVFRAAPPMAFPRASQAEILELERRWWYDIVSAVFEPFGSFAEFDKYFEELYDVFGDQRGWEAFPDAPPVLEQLRSQNIRLGIISNFDSRLFPLLDSLRLREYFDLIVISSRAGAAKPAPAIFHAALDQAGAKAELSLYVGDNPEEDCAGAAAVGMTPLLVDRKGIYRSESTLYRIENLRSVVGRVIVDRQ